MKRIVLAASILVLAVNQFAVASGFDFTGNWWIARSKEEKAIYAAGMLDGVLTGQMLVVSSATAETGTLEITKYNHLFKKTFGNATAGQMVAGLDHFYSDFRNRRIHVFAGLY